MEVFLSITNKSVYMYILYFVMEVFLFITDRCMYMYIFRDGGISLYYQPMCVYVYFVMEVFLSITNHTNASICMCSD